MTHIIFEWEKSDNYGCTPLRWRDKYWDFSLYNNLHHVVAVRSLLRRAKIRLLRAHKLTIYKTNYAHKISYTINAIIIITNVLLWFEIMFFFHPNNHHCSYCLYYILWYAYSFIHCPTNWFTRKILHKNIKTRYWVIIIRHDAYTRSTPVYRKNSVISYGYSAYIG